MRKAGKRYPKLDETALKEFCSEFFNYDPDTGILTLKKKRGPRDPKNVGDTLGTPEQRDGYLVISIKDNQYKLHRIAWFMYYGVMPKRLDHRNRNKLDNRISNLREVTVEQNNKNKPRQSNNRSGHTGVRRKKGMSSWIVEIGVKGKQVHIGTFDSFDDAVKARKEAEKKYGYGSTSTNSDLNTRNASGVTGVYYDAIKHKWAASIQHENKKYNLGRFDEIEDAITSRRRAEDNIRKYGKVYVY